MAQVDPPPAVHFLNDPTTHLSLEIVDNDEGDIYRGAPLSPPRTPRPESVSSSSSSSSTSSSSFVFAGRLGAISDLVEHAISHWARAWVSTSSLDTSSISSATSTSTTNSITTKSRTRRRRHRSSTANLHNARSEREVAARIRARERARHIPREFVLYTPAYPTPSSKTSVPPDQQEGVLRTSSLPIIITKLSAAMKDNLKFRRARGIVSGGPSRQPTLPHTVSETPPLLHHDYMLPDEISSSASSSQASGKLPDRGRRRMRKGKQRAETTIPSTSPHPSVFLSERLLDRAWWLDVSSPTWEDMRAIGKLLHLHPLTLEDILQQDPREKLELFPKLGYYFIAFRAIESKKTRALASTDILIPDEGIVGEVNVYLVVFREGICSFHFADISEHADAVRNKVLMLDQTATMSSDWIAHGIIDSIVDAYFPFLDEIEKEVSQIESVVFSSSETENGTQPYTSRDSSVTVFADEKTPTSSETQDSLTKEKHDLLSPGIAVKTRFTTPRQSRFSWCRMKFLIGNWRALLVKKPAESNLSKPAAATVHRMSSTRRLVTSLTRFLASKSEVVAQIKKRMLKTGEFGLGNGTGDDKDVFMYMGDVQDHILTLQQALAHYERMLSQSHPIYLSQLRISASQSKSGTDKAIVFLTIVSLGVLCVQTLIGLNSMNIHIPTNEHVRGGHFYVFGIVISLAFIIVVLYAIIVRRWWVLAKRKRGRW